jgi:3-keto-disaccharide hydrolase
MSVLIRCLAVALLISASTLLAADPNAVAFLDPAKAGIDYELQGEYVGMVQNNDGDLKVGVQIIALGDDTFRAEAFIGGLPGDGWSRGDKSHTAESKLQDGLLRFTSENGKIVSEVKDGSIIVYGGDTKVAELTKTHRQSPTLGAKPPEGAIVLFDGSSTIAWNGGEVIDNKWLGAQNIDTKEKFGDHQLHIEFRTPFMPTSRGQGRGNSGVYVQSRYEVQVLDSFGLEGKNNECGGIYSIAQPIVNMCLPPLTWQAYDIDFTAARYDAEGKKTENARITVRHNGVKIHDDVELTHGTPGRHAESSGPDSLFLQNHGNPVVFRNIWAVKK